MGREPTPFSKIKKLEQPFRAHCSISHLNPGCLLHILPVLTKITRPMAYMRRYCAGCKYWREVPVKKEEEVIVKEALPGPKGKGEEIEKLFRQGLSGYKIAMRLGLYPSQVYTYLKRRRLR